MAQQVTNERSTNQQVQDKKAEGQVPATNSATSKRPMGGDAAPGATSGKRRGLTLPPRGQALSRLQDLEQDGPALAEDDPPLSSEVMDRSAVAERSNTQTASNAVNTASSNAVSDAVSHKGSADSSNTVSKHEESSDRRPTPQTDRAMPSISPAVRERAAREPTTRITVDMPDSLHKRLSYLSVETRRSIKDLVLEALDVAYFHIETNG